VLREHSIDCLPVDLSRIAEEEGIPIHTLPGSSRGVSGMLLRNGNEFAIMYAMHLGNDGFERFSIAHELGHYFLPGHPERVIGADGVHISDAGFVSCDELELQADQFAASLLMPSPLFTKAMRGSRASLPAIESLAKECRTSLTATAIRYCEVSEYPVAAVVTNGQSIDFCCMSDALRQVSGLDRLCRGHPIPRRTATHRFNQDHDNVMQARRTEDMVSLLDWFGGTKDLQLSEEIVGLGRYDKTLTILVLDNDGGAPEEDDDEGDLEESWTPRFRR
jgi:Zn-dependent peptidase ImmA (M78 family)